MWLPVAFLRLSEVCEKLTALLLSAEQISLSSGDKVSNAG